MAQIKDETLKAAPSVSDQFPLDDASNVTWKTTLGAMRRSVLSITSSATPSVNADIYNAVEITALGVAITSMSAGLSGTPGNMQSLLYLIKDNGVARAITWGASFESAGNTLPITTVAGKRLLVGVLYSTVTGKWGCWMSIQEY